KLGKSRASSTSTDNGRPTRRGVRPEALRPACRERRPPMCHMTRPFPQKRRKRPAGNDCPFPHSLLPGKQKLNYIFLIFFWCLEAVRVCGGAGARPGAPRTPAARAGRFATAL